MKCVLKTLILAALAAVFALALTSCGASVKNEAAMRKDIAAYGCLPSGLSVDGLDIRLRQTDKKTKTDEVWVTVSASAGDVKCKLGYVLSYEYYNKGGWVLEDVERDDDGAWEASGVDRKTILGALDGYSDFYLGQTAITDSEIVHEGPSDDLTEYEALIHVESENDAAFCELEYRVTYTLGHNGWEFSGISGHLLGATPKAGMDQDEITAYLSDVYGLEQRYDYAEPDYENGVETHYVSLLTKHAYMTKRDVIAAQCRFDQQNLLWEIAGCEKIDTGYEWDALGTWTCSGEDVDVRALKSYPYSYSATVTITQEDPDTLKVVYDVKGFFRHDENISGTVYFDLLLNPHHKATSLAKEHWYLESDSIAFCATIRFDADEGLKLRQDGSGAMICTRD